MEYKRQQFFVKKGFQLRYIGLILIIMVVSTTVVGYTIYYNTWTSLGSKLANVYPQGRLINLFNSVNTKLFVNLVFVAMLCVGLGIIASHRIAGPIDRMIRFMDSVADGDYTKRLKLREKDELQDLAEAINRLVERLEKEKKS